VPLVLFGKGGGSEKILYIGGVGGMRSDVPEDTVRVFAHIFIEFEEKVGLVYT
jgi:hypothetical protein